MLLFACSKVFCGYIYNAVRINVECNFDLRYSAWSRRDSVQPELSQRLVIFGELSLSLYDIDIYGCLVICRCGEDLALLGRNRRISFNQSCCNAAHRLD